MLLVSFYTLKSCSKTPKALVRHWRKMPPTKTQNYNLLVTTFSTKYSSPPPFDTPYLNLWLVDCCFPRENSIRTPRIGWISQPRPVERLPHAHLHPHVQPALFSLHPRPINHTTTPFHNVRKKRIEAGLVERGTPPNWAHISYYSILIARLPGGKQEQKYVQWAAAWF